MKRIRNFLVLVALFVTLLSIPVFAGERSVNKIHVSVNPKGAYFTIDALNKIFLAPCYVKLENEKDYEIKFFKDGFKPKVINYNSGDGDISVNLEEEYNDTINLGYEDLDEVIEKDDFEVKKKKKNIKVKAEITSEPANAFFTIDDSGNVFTAPETVKFKKNQEYTLVFKLKGYKNKRIKYTGGDGDLHVELMPKNYILKVNTNVENANVIIDGKRLGKTPLKIELEPGIHMIKIKKDGYKTYKKEINIKKHKEKLIIELEYQPTLKVKLPKGANIYINGRQRKINWAKINKDWKTVKLKSKKDMNEIIIEYYGSVIRKEVNFDNSTITIHPDDFVRRQRRRRRRRNRYIY